MYPFNKSNNDIIIEDIQILIEGKVSESRTLDYKRDIYSGNDKGKVEFLRDVSALANTVGGYLIIGMEEEEGVPTIIQGIEIDNYDNLILQYENLLRMSVDPPIRGVEFKPVDWKDNRKILIIEVPRSVSRPHVVKHGNHFRFYGRHSSGNYPYEVDDIRRAILESETLATKIKNFRNDRLAQIATGETLIPLCQGGKVVLHLLPITSFEFSQQYDISTISATDIPPLYINSWDHRINFDGFMTYYDDRDTGCGYTYTQIFRNGIIEAVDTFLLGSFSDVKKKGFDSVAFEQVLVEGLNHYVSTLSKINVSYPLWICLSLLQVKDYQIFVSNQNWSRHVHPIDRDELIIPEVQIEGANILGEIVLKPAFDSVWNACGYKQSLNYDKDGNWLLKRQ